MYHAFTTMQLSSSLCTNGRLPVLLLIIILCSSWCTKVTAQQQQQPPPATLPYYIDYYHTSGLPEEQMFDGDRDAGVDNVRIETAPRYRQYPPELQSYISQMLSNQFHQPQKSSSTHQGLTSLGKRQSFSAWAGKRNVPLTDGQLDNLRSLLQRRLLVPSFGSKRQPFSAWAGKRSVDESVLQGQGSSTGAFDSELGKQDKRSETHSTGLQEIMGSDTDEQNETAKRAFSAWSGKRSGGDSHRYNTWSSKSSNI